MNVLIAIIIKFIWFWLPLTQGNGESFHGGCFVALAGKDSVILASDSRFSSPRTGPYLVGQHSRIVFRIGPRCLVGCYGLESDARQVFEYIQKKIESIAVTVSDEDSDHETFLDPHTVSSLISNYIYRERLYCSPIVIGLKSSEMKPYICTMDSLGAMTVVDDYGVIGTSTAAILSILEGQQSRMNTLSTVQLMAMVEDILTISLQRDVMSGCEVNVLAVTSNGIYQKNFDTFDV